eukprot:CAMPEP_0201868680 /NCGR_PEP_ID=MMETSP0902-20130614/2465_1 /ASSEMBLY_ACC=CAM_ASM_000551 /TAXON_ID=420261 /ORGANISM="Thalassiosira antarctica, Strain CCMP982" /LENGTH=151 /DNA_ID=CAMNT_0048394045 /DNA_START=25 /DNA_END=480 /DNA_ORIENTATION=+
MRSASSTFSLILATAAVPKSSAFVQSRAAIATPRTVLSANRDGTEKQWLVDEETKESEASPTSVDGFQIPNPFAELGSMFSNFDDVVDDFFNKRMGAGEVFYGKRKYKPSGNYSSEYKGGGLTDLSKIEAAREFREMRAAMRGEAMEEDGK